MQDQNYQKNHNESHNRNQVERHDNILKREWVTVAKEPNKHGLAFTILNYNILSQKLLEMHEYLYRDHSWQALKWHQRFSNLVGEILHNNPDILCCQVRKCAAKFIRCSFQYFRVLGIFRKCSSLTCKIFKVVYVQWTTMSFIRSELVIRFVYIVVENVHRNLTEFLFQPDGCAIFYKRHLFNLIEHHKVEFEQPQLNSEVSRENPSNSLGKKIWFPIYSCSIVKMSRLFVNSRWNLIPL